MPVDFTEIFKKYEALLAETDALFARVKQTCGDVVSCGLGCDDCCHALFDVSLVEALYLNRRFQERFPEGAGRARILELAEASDRAHYKLKRKAFKATEKGVSTAEVLADLAKERIRCPLLNENKSCDLYEHRPVTCRLYGLPLDIGGQAHTCGKSGFTPGGQYPTVKIEILQDRLMALAQECVRSFPTSRPGLADMLIPVSMAIVTDYDDEYLGVTEEADVPPPPAAPGDCQTCAEGPDSEACRTCGSANTWIIPGPNPDKRDDGEGS